MLAEKPLRAHLPSGCISDWGQRKRKNERKHFRLRLLTSPCQAGGGAEYSADKVALSLSRGRGTRIGVQSRSVRRVRFFWNLAPDLKCALPIMAGVVRKQKAAKLY